jgi:hypothetical protein
MTDLHQELRDRLALARHARRHGFMIIRAHHLALVLDARRKLRSKP